MYNVSIYDLRPADGRKSFYGKAQAVADGSWCYLRSYNTIVCGIAPDGSFTRLWAGYSATTMRHINSFRRGFGLPAINKTQWCKMEAV